MSSEKSEDKITYFVWRRRAVTIEESEINIEGEQ